MDELTSATGIVALAGAVLGLIAALAALVLAIKLRRLRRAQQTILGEGGNRDLVQHANDLQLRLERDAGRLEAEGARLARRANEIEELLRGSISHSAVVRYDAYDEMTGRQSSSLALLDARRTGVVLSSIVHREQARVYAKRVVDGRSEIDLSPEEKQAVEEALQGASDGVVHHHR